MNNPEEVKELSKLWPSITVTCTVYIHEKQGLRARERTQETAL